MIYQCDKCERRVEGVAIIATRRCHIPGAIVDWSLRWLCPITGAELKRAPVPIFGELPVVCDGRMQQCA